jgi:hypothetical protein
MAEVGETPNATGLAQLGLRDPRPREERSSRQGWHHARRGPLEEAGVQLRFQATHASRDRRLRHAQFARRGTNAAGLDDRHEIPDLTQPHGDNGSVSRR